MKTIITQNNMKYSVGSFINGKKIAEIKIAPINFQGDPYDHYIGINENKEMVFSVNCLLPCEIHY